MAISKAQFKAANARGAAVIARGPIAQAARYDSRRGLVVISLEGGCEFALPQAPTSPTALCKPSACWTVTAVIGIANEFTLSARC